MLRWIQRIDVKDCKFKHHGVVEGYKKIEDSVVGGYKKIEDGVVEGFGKVTDKCVEVMFAKEGETVEQAKDRLSGKKTEQDAEVADETI